MGKKKIKWIIAKEGLIFIGLAIVLYVLLLFLQNIAVVFPKYRLEFANGQIHTIVINPEIRNDSDYKRLLREVHNPAPKLIEKRIKEFMQMENIKSSLKEAKCINSTQLYISELYSSLLITPFIFKVFIIYLTLLAMRFIIWAIRVLQGGKV
jgi:hypothetical protein